jgi:hypothetical protein
MSIGFRTKTPEEIRPALAEMSDAQWSTARLYGNFAAACQD